MKIALVMLCVVGRIIEGTMRRKNHGSLCHQNDVFLLTFDLDYEVLCARPPDDQLAFRQLKFVSVARHVKESKVESIKCKD